MLIMNAEYLNKVKNHHNLTRHFGNISVLEKWERLSQLSKSQYDPPDLALSNSAARSNNGGNGNIINNSNNSKSKSNSNNNRNSNSGNNRNRSNNSYRISNSGNSTSNRNSGSYNANQGGGAVPPVARRSRIPPHNSCASSSVNAPTLANQIKALEANRKRMLNSHAIGASEYEFNEKKYLNLRRKEIDNLERTDPSAAQSAMEKLQRNVENFEQEKTNANRKRGEFITAEEMRRSKVGPT